MNRWQAELAALSQKGDKFVTQTLLYISLTKITVKNKKKKKKKTKNNNNNKKHNRTFNKTHYNESTALERPVMNYLRSGQLCWGCGDRDGGFKLALLDPNTGPQIPLL